MTYRERAQRAPSRFELRPAPGYWVVGGLVTLLAVLVAGVVIAGAQRHGAPPVGVVVRGTAGLAVVVIFWFGTAAYRVRGAIIVDDEHVTLVDPRGRARWRLAVREVGFTVSGGDVLLQSPGGVRRLSTRVFRAEEDLDRLSRELLVRSAGEQGVAALEGVFAELFAKADPTSVSTRPAASATESQLDARLDDELAKLE